MFLQNIDNVSVLSIARDHRNLILEPYDNFEEIIEISHVESGPKQIVLFFVKDKYFFFSFYLQ